MTGMACSFAGPRRHEASGSSVSSFLVPVQSLGSMAYLSLAFCEDHNPSEDGSLPAGEYTGKLTVLERKEPA